MTTIIQAQGLTRSFGDLVAVDHIDMTINAGSVLGLIGPNGAGKTTLLRSLLGLTEYEGDLQVLGFNPRKQRSELMQSVCFIADSATLPKWMRVEQVLDYAAGVHPKFDRGMAEAFLADTEVGPNRKVRELSKGMTVQLHLALVMAIDAKLLILDEPTLGLDILFRKRFFEQLLNDYFDEQRTIIVSTHQVEEIENILTDVMFLKHGKVVLHQPMTTLDESYAEVTVVGDRVAQAKEIPYIGRRSILGGQAFIYEGEDRARLEELGDVCTPSISDLFVAKMSSEGGSA